jgi:hypothetical protein
MTEYKVLEMAKDRWDENRDHITTDSWDCDSYCDAVLECAAREVEQTVQGYDDSFYRVTEDGEIVGIDDMPESDDVFARVHSWGYEPREILVAMGEDADEWCEET